ncbi:MAG TPA: helix-turn-helix domain-containing protein [Gryllotalpicola sp.]
MNDERMGLELRAARHAALGDPTRLRIVDLLARSDRSPGELMAVLGIASNLLGHHLGVLEGVGLIVRTRSEGDRRRSYVHLLPEGSGFARPAGKLTAPRVVFVCTGNSARSPIAAALWERTSRVPAASAGTHPAAAISAGAVAAARRQGVTVRGHTPAAVADVVRPEDLVIAVCDRAYEELGGGSALHWSVPNPRFIGTARAYDDAVAELGRRVVALAPHLAAA